MLVIYFIDVTLLEQEDFLLAHKHRRSNFLNSVLISTIDNSRDKPVHWSDISKPK